MRTLTVTREKAVCGRLRKVKLYVEDASASEITLANIPCRLLGTLKNGETQSFEIPEEAVRIFAIMDKFSAACCNDCYPIPAGSEAVVLTGKRTFNPVSGNAFRFSGLTDEAALGNRVKSCNKGVLALMSVLLVVSLAANVVGALQFADLMIESPESFEGEGYSVTLTDYFLKTHVEGAELACASPRATVAVFRDTFEENYRLNFLTEREYVNLLLKELATGHPNTGARPTEDGLTYFEYYVYDDAWEEQTCRVFVFKGEDAYWRLHVIYPTANKQEMNQISLGWARSFQWK
jgi:hypothetical protein